MAASRAARRDPAPAGVTGISSLDENPVALRGIEEAAPRREVETGRKRDGNGRVATLRFRPAPFRTPPRRGCVHRVAVSGSFRSCA